MKLRHLDHVSYTAPRQPRPNRTPRRAARAAAQGASSDWAPLLRTLPEETLSPILWSEAEREELLRGSPVLAEAAARRRALEQEWAEIGGLAAADAATYPPGERWDCQLGAGLLRNGAQ